MRHLAIDIGASSGRAIVGEAKAGRIHLTEVYRFDNGAALRGNQLCWDIDALFENVLLGMEAARDAGLVPDTMGIDTWAVDYVLLGDDDRRLGECVSYRDVRTRGVREALEQSGTLSFAEHYARTGIQYQPFNTAYQLLALRRDDPACLAAARTLLMVPDYLGFLLTGEKASEYTNASTTALVGAASRTWDDALIDRLGLPRSIFQAIRMPGTQLGRLRPEVSARVGFDCKVVLPATHDTGSAWLAVPARDAQAAYISSGTWSLVGTELSSPICTPESAAANFTNEGGVAGTYRYLKNVMGLWMIQSVRRELARPDGSLPSWDQLVDAASKAHNEGFSSVVDAQDERFLAPQSMTLELQSAAKEEGQAVPEGMGQLAATVYDSLAACYARSIRQMQELTGIAYTSVNIVGGGSANRYLNQATADAAGLSVFAGPMEGTALGNLMVQMVFSGEFASVADARAAIPNSFKIEEVAPNDQCNI
ncbi:MAG: rhamnulokinase [Tractidigestivibacter sp.]|jgi:rhamnulokinase|uniref:rhamnulokinase n=1 Tax=Tractidigestivibacter sp. TaxID=2847320 RepID=UPI003D8C3964